MIDSPTFTKLTVADDLSLELIADKHAEPLLELVNKNREHLREWLPWVDSMQTVTAFHNYISQCKGQHQQGSDYNYVIYYDHDIVGRIGIHNIQASNRSGAIGYWINKTDEGKGIIGRCCTTLLQQCFEQLLLNRVEIKCGTGNLKSAAIPERLHFTREGVLRQAEWLNGRFHDMVLYSLLKEEWDRLPENAPRNWVK